MSKKARKAGGKDEDEGAPQVAFAAVVEAFSRVRSVTAGPMFGRSNVVLKANGKIFAMLVRDTFVVKLPTPRVDEMESAGQGVRFDGFRGRPMKEWICVSGDPADWVPLAREAKRFVAGT